MRIIKIFMKATILSTLLFSSALCFGQTPSEKQSIKYGALAIDRNNGFYYGWAYDQNSLYEAKQRAIQECNNRGGNCTVVLEWSGSGCAAYRTIKENVGTAYGWGLAATKEEADAIAIQECLKRSNGISADNYVWACNSGDVHSLKKILNDTQESPQNNQTTTTESKGFVSFNGNNLVASGSCPSDSVAMLTTDNESLLVLFNNIPSGGTASVNSNFFTKGCSSCFGISVQDINASLTYVATGGTFSRNGNEISFNISVKELSSLIEGSGNSFTVSGEFTCEE